MDGDGIAVDAAGAGCGVEAGNAPATPPGLVVVDGLTYSYPVAPSGIASSPVLSDLSFRVEPGQLLGIFGTADSGKTTLCLALNGIVPRRTGGTFAGRVTIGDWDTRRHPIAALATRVALVFQEPEANFVGLAVEDEVAFGPENLGVPPAEIERRIDWALAVVGMTDHRSATPSKLSGGQKQRVAIAAALAMRPAVLVLDEPTAALDPVAAAEVLSVITTLKRAGAMAIVLVSQDADALAAQADHVIVLDGGRAVAAGPPHHIFAPNQFTLLRQLGLSVPAAVEIAAGLNARLGTDFAFVTPAEAEVALLTGLSAPPRR